MKKPDLDLYTDYLLSTFGAATGQSHLTVMHRVSSTPDDERHYGACHRWEAEVVKTFDGSLTAKSNSTRRH